MILTNASTKRILSIVITLAMLIGMLPVYTLATDHPTTTLGEEVTVTLDGIDVTEAIYKFVPEKTGDYLFYSFDNDHDTFGHIYDENMNEIVNDDDSGNNRNFKIRYNFIEGTVYYLKGRFFSTSNGGSFKMAVSEPVSATNMYIDGDDTVYLYEGDEYEPDIIFEPANHITENVTWATNNKDVAYVTDYGKIIVAGVGTATITATSENGLTDSIIVNSVEATVITADTEYTVDYVADLEYYFARYKFIPEKDGIYGFYSYNNNNASIDLVCYDIEDDSHFYGDDWYDGNERKEMELRAGRTYYLTAECYGTDSPFNVKIEALVPATNMSFVKDSYSGAYGSSLVLDLVFEPANAITENVTFTSSDNDVLSFDGDNVAQLHKIGNVTVTAESDNGLKATCTVSVTDYMYLSVEKPATVYNGPSNDYSTLFKFTPDVSGSYKFFSKGSYDTHGYIFDIDLNLIADNDQGGDSNFSVTAELEAGVTYILKTRAYGNWSSGSYTVQIDMVDGNGNTIHDIESYTCTETNHSGYCNNCEQNITQPHSIDVDGMCICGHKHEHEFKYTYTTEEHKAYCDNCGTNFYEEHSFDENGKCVCGFTDHECVYEWYDFDYNNIEILHNTRCIICLEYAGIEHGFDENGVCTDCGYTKHEHIIGDYSHDIYYHNGKCDICGFIVNEEHTFDDNGNCICGYTAHEHDFSKYEYADKQYHYEVCTVCGTNGVTLEHSYDEGGVCVCGYTSIDGLMLGDTRILDGQYLDYDGNITDTEPADWAASFQNGILTLKDIKVYAEGNNAYGIFYDEDLEIILHGDAVFSSTAEDCIHIASGNLTIGGDGTLTVIAKGDYDGIDAANNGDVTINSGTIIINAVDHGIETEEKLTINGGTVIVNAGDDGFDTEDTRIYGGVIYICAEDNGIDADDIIIIDDGTVDIITEDDNGINADESIEINGGNITINANKYGIYNTNADYDDNIIEINGGTLDITSGEGAMQSFIGITIDSVMGEHEIIGLGKTYCSYYDEYYNNAYALGKDEEKLYSVYLSDNDDDNFGITIKNNWITLDRNEFEYTGEEIVPVVSVKDPESGKTLVKDEDYTLVWSADHMTEEGAYYVVIEGIGNYSGTHYKIVSIRRSFIYVGGVLMENGDYLATGGNEVTDVKPDGGYAYYNNGVLELNDYSYEGSGYLYNEDEVYNALIFSDYSLEINLKGVSELIGTADENDGIAARGEITVNGSGNLTINSQYGIYCYNGNFNLKGGNVSITSRYDSVYVNSGDINITGGKLSATSEYDCIGSYGNINVTGGEVIVDSANGGITCEESMTVAGGTLQINTKNGLSIYRDLTVSGGIMEVTGKYGIFVSNSASFSGGCVSIDCERIAFESDTTENTVLSDGVVLMLPVNGEIRNFNDASFIFNEDGSVAKSATITSTMYGDANCDNMINLSDVSMVLKHIAKWDVQINENIADANADGMINLFDVTLMLQYIAKWDVVLGKAE